LAPPSVLRYVVAHEVAHLAEMNHGPRFWRLVHYLAGEDIDTPQEWLRRHGPALHRYG
jgi:predicted metal-dependent hydrolase